MKLSENLKRIRKDNNLSQEQLAEKLGVSRQAVSKWESNQSYPEMDKVLLICKLFNYNIDELMNENVKEVDEAKQSKININKYIDDFFGFITKTVDVFISMRFRDRIKCLLEILFISILLIAVYFIMSAIGGSIFANVFGILPYKIYSVIRNILEAICTILFLFISITIILHIFKIRYLDYYEIVKENNTDEEQSEKEEDISEEKKYDEKRKIFIEKKKEKIIIRDPEHSQSKFLNGIFRLILTFIKFMAVCVAIGFMFSFIALFCLLILSFMFVKTGLVFLGSLFSIISAIIINFIILELFYNFITSKKLKKTRMAISFVISLILAGVGIGIILIGITKFNIVQNDSDLKMEEVYEYDMTENLSLDYYNTCKFIEEDTDKVKIMVKYTEFTGIAIHNNNDIINIYCYKNNQRTMDLVKTIINDLNNKEIKAYHTRAEITVYASKENIEKLKQNRAKRYELTIENELDQVNNKNAKLERMLEEMEDKITDKESKIEDLQLEIEQLKEEIRVNQNSQIEIE